MKTGGTFQEIVAVAVSLGGLWALLLAQQFPPAVNQSHAPLTVFPILSPQSHQSSHSANHSSPTPPTPPLFLLPPGHINSFASPGCSRVAQLPVYAFVSLGCYAVGALGYGLMRFPTCPHEGALLRQDIVEAKEYLSKHGLQ
ncbi:unnamed protein product [Closterium sp. NIES-64]|nr:unnamed protein product [Closterium sp. NIES-64]